MKYFNHTQGPWRILGPDDFGDYTVLPSDQELAIAAVVNGEMRRMGGIAKEHHANANLIAAAPELYRALHNLLENVVFYERQGIDNEVDYQADRKNAIQVAKDALALVDKKIV